MEWNRTVYFGESMELTRRTSSVKNAQPELPAMQQLWARTNRRRGERVTTIKVIRHWRQVARRTDLSRAHVWGAPAPFAPVLDCVSGVETRRGGLRQGPPTKRTA